MKLKLIPGIGHIAAKKLIAYCGGIEAIFHERKAHLLKIPGLGEKAAEKIVGANLWARVEEELRFIDENKIQSHFYLDQSYPQKLTHCEDAPILLFSKGKVDLNAKKSIAIVGTRNATVKGKAICAKMVEDLVPHQATIISGLAYGIDITAHQSALKNKLPTVGVLACGLDDLYPKSHFHVAQQMMNNGGMITEYLSQTKIHPTNFVERNRIVAGMVDAVIVVESSKKGGSLITADLANGYNRDVFAVPGRIDDNQSLGCNQLIKSNKAALIETAKDLEYILGWEVEEKKIASKNQRELFVELNTEERAIVELLKDADNRSLDEVALAAKMPISKASTLLLNLEFKGLVMSLPGKVYQLH